jgi:hypothetical protein
MAVIIPALPYTLTNGTTADANQVMADLNDIVSGVNTNAAHNGPNSDITSLTGLTTPLSTAQGGTNVGVVGAINSLFTSDGTNGYWNIGIKGVVDGSNAAAGQIGEYISAAQPTGQTLTSGTGLNLTSISLTAGDWNIDAVVTYNMSAGGTTYADTWINPPNTLVASAPGYAAVGSSNGTLGGPLTLNVAPTRLSITTTTTVNLTVRASFTGPTVTAAGTLYARRVR